jgi:ribonuclease R
MLKLDMLNQLKQLKHDIKESRNLMEGTVKGSPNKFGFVSLDSGKDVYLPAEEMEKVLPGDRIEVEIVKDSKNKKVAKIERFISSPTKFFCGKYITKGKTHFIEPDIAGMNRWLFVPPQKRKNAQNKDLVKCRITQHPFKSGNAQAAVLEVIGQEQDIGIEFNYACKKHDIRKAWPAEVEQELAQLSESTIVALASTRNDLSELSFITIDSHSTVDIDDAIYVEKIASGWKLSVAIADPSALIPKGSEIEKEALKRASSLYFPGQHISMLPEKIAGDLCSLKEGSLRLAKVVQMDVNEAGDILEYNIVEAAIKSHKKFSYSDLSHHYDSPSPEINPSLSSMLLELKQLTHALLSSRQNKALVQADRKEFYFELDEQQKISDIKSKTATPAHKIVEEAMVATNCCIADFLAKKAVPSIFISHQGLRSDRLEIVDKVLTESLPDYKTNAIAELNGFIQTIQAVSKSDALKPLQLLISRQLDKSNLSADASPHFGMGLQQYTTFTSPLRKAQDYLIHRQISALLQGKSDSIDHSRLIKLTEGTQAIRNTVNDAEQWLKCQFIAKKQDIYQASVLRVFSTGFQVKLIENGIEGFVSTKEMDGKYSFNQERMIITSKGQSFELDQIVKVQLKQIDWTRKQIQFALVTDPSEEKSAGE